MVAEQRRSCRLATPKNNSLLSQCHPVDSAPQEAAIQNINKYKNKCEAHQTCRQKLFTMNDISQIFFWSGSIVMLNISLPHL